MKYQTTHTRQPITWRQFANKGYCAFESLHREVRIGVLSIATLGIAAQAHAVATCTVSYPTDDEQSDKEQEMDEVTVSGTMAPLTQLQSARIVSVLSRQDITEAGAQSINDLLKLAAGVDVRQRGGFGIQTDISIDGGTCEQITLLLNGVNICNPQTGHHTADFPISISDIERIEVLEGAASRVYGGTAFGGAINIVTRKDNRTNAEVGAEAGHWGTAQADARLAWTLRRLACSVSGGGGRSDGGTLNSDWRKGQLYHHGEFAHETFNLNWQFGFSKKSYGANTFYSAAYPNQYEQNERYLISVGAEAKGRIHFAPSVYWNRAYDNFQLIRHTATGENFHQVDVYGVRLGSHFNWWGGRTAMGAELRQEGILSTSLGRDMDETKHVRARLGHGQRYTREDNRTNVSFNLEHNILLNHWTVSAGVMANMSSCVDHRFHFYPGVDVAFRPSARWKVCLSYNEGFRLPTFTDLYYKSPTHEGNRGLRPEVSRSLQIGSTFSTKGVQAMLRGFYHRGRGLIDWVLYTPDDVFHSTSFNLDNVGLQAHTHLNFAELTDHNTWLRHLKLEYTYIHQWRHDNQQVYKSNYTLEYLRHKLVATLNHHVASHLSANWSVRWQDRMGNDIYRPYATLDVKVQWTERNYELYVAGTNVTDRRYQDLGNVPQPGISVLGGARWRF